MSKKEITAVLTVLAFVVSVGVAAFWGAKKGAEKAELECYEDLAIKYEDLPDGTYWVTRIVGPELVLVFLETKEAQIPFVVRGSIPVAVGEGKPFWRDRKQEHAYYQER